MTPVFIIVFTTQIHAQYREDHFNNNKGVHQFEMYREGKNIFLNFYQNWISPVKGGNTCPMHPSCSQYAKNAFHVFPWHLAYIKCCERLMRCGHELHFYPTVCIHNQNRWYDPVCNMNHNISEGVLKKCSNSVPCTRDYSNHGFPEFLVESGEYNRAITEYYRLLFYSTDSVRTTVLFRKIGMCYYNSMDYDGYISFLKANKNRFKSDSTINFEMAYYLARCYYYLNQYEKSISVLEWSTLSPPKEFYNEAQFLLGISYARLFDFQKAVKKMQLIEQDYPQKINVDKLILSFNHSDRLPKRDPFLAGTLSFVIPGAGYLYCSRPKTALTSFIINGILFWTIRDAVVKKQAGFASAVSFFGLGWYIGNIKGSADAATVYNHNIRNHFIDKALEKEHFTEYKK